MIKAYLWYCKLNLMTRKVVIVVDMCLAHLDSSPLCDALFSQKAVQPLYKWNLASDPKVWSTTLCTNFCLFFLVVKFLIPRGLPKNVSLPSADRLDVCILPVFKSKTFPVSTTSFPRHQLLWSLLRQACFSVIWSKLTELNSLFFFPAFLCWIKYSEHGGLAGEWSQRLDF